jgi:hypothetical protein
MHVENMAVTRKNAGPNCSGQCTVWIEDQNGQPVAAATVYVTATGPVGGSYNGITGADGSVSFETGKTRDCAGEWCFEVTNVTHASCDYDPGSNVVTVSCESGHVSGERGSVALLGAEIRHQGLYLAPSCPNPFRDGTSIGFNLPTAGHARLEILNTAGQRVAVLTDSDMTAGFHRIAWDASGVPSGVYFSRLIFGSENTTKRMLIIQ